MEDGLPSEIGIFFYQYMFPQQLAGVGAFAWVRNSGHTKKV